ncbi:phosphate signaling complex protein PhoU [Mycolicibacterium goodii]|uniref:Phosphate-specific transport system accessory protein PhoU n=1 Tax=Mycolicibacterium goodii TaxID=134601 RepID=A0ABS6HJS9_MYCGD|nr:phosphate signaling complex protein PhoU [Mycolicibacterium goodii]OKH63270.1 PhoU family transcriptional regulator [Mycobacterium sp. SWH-M5]MBU8809248.1 phosphate signaling complex protein PhoU [Mycolicibacterium goodii]MBU8821855.1 phosphate signaling complex protein PhoU [Mycolicibacterium goodii]MBU8828351.1 phosphate signaling complex protein PhoU [Mycolicibacterium goodii]MBU8836847.1 phosphate signaling complex protein PhoU [Mycolicibacterium goodii]
MRTAFHEQLTALSAELGEMCGLAASAMERATQALLQADLLLAEEVLDTHELIALRDRHVEQTVFKLLALQQPVASELRMVVGSMHIAADLDRMGALASHVARISRLRHPDCAVPADVRASFAAMGAGAVKLARTAQEVLISRDPDTAARLRDEDDAVDAEHRHLFTLLMDHKWQDGVSCAVDVALLSRYYERFADHAVEIGKRVVFEATGGMPSHKKLALSTGRR